MSDIEIDLGFIGDDIIALCDDAEATYAFHAALKGDRYYTKMSSSHGVISNSTYLKSTGTRQMIFAALSQHMDLIAEIEAGQIDMISGLPQQRH